MHLFMLFFFFFLEYYIHQLVLHLAESNDDKVLHDLIGDRFFGKMNDNKYYGIFCNEFLELNLK